MQHYLLFINASMLFSFLVFSYLTFLKVSSLMYTVLKEQFFPSHTQTFEFPGKTFLVLKHVSLSSSLLAESSHRNGPIIIFQLLHLVLIRDSGR